MPARIRVLSNNGFSLIEMMIAIVFIMISMLALLTAITTSTHMNLENDLRNTAIRLSNQTAETLLALPLTLTLVDPELTEGDHERLPGSTAQNEKGFPPEAQTIRGSRKEYTILWNVTSDTGNTDVKVITITVMYDHKSITHQNISVIYKPKVL